MAHEKVTLISLTAACLYRRRRSVRLPAILLILVLAACSSGETGPATPAPPVVTRSPKMANSGNKTFIPVLLESMRFQPLEEWSTAVESFMSRIKYKVPVNEGVVFPEEEQCEDGWIEWLGWHPEIQPPDGYAGWKGRLYSLIDQRRRAFLYEGVKTEIRLEEIAWGGVARDGIPDLINPPGLSPEEDDYLSPDDRLFGVSINGEHRAYPLCILNPHELANDVIAGVPIASAY